jgi:hypothetical protein
MITDSVVAYVLLCRRAMHLVNASYIMTGQVTERNTQTALFLLHTMPKEAPISEKTLRMFMRITKEILPSESLQQTYR